MTDATLRKLFETARLPASRFNHETHVRMAWIYVREHDLPTAITLFCRDLRNYANTLGVPDKYHETITHFFMMVVDKRLSRQPEADWGAFMEANTDLIGSASTLLSKHYSSDVLKTDTARERFLQPDKAAI